MKRADLGICGAACNAAPNADSRIVGDDAVGDLRCCGLIAAICVAEVDAATVGLGEVARDSAMINAWYCSKCESLQ